MSIRKCLFSDSPVQTSTPRQWSESEIAAIITPCTKGHDSTDFATGSDLNVSIEVPARKLHPRRSLFSGKRQLKDHDNHAPHSKKVRNVRPDEQTPDTTATVDRLTPDTTATSTLDHLTPEATSITKAVDRLTLTHNLLGDSSGEYSLPTTRDRNSDLKAISTDTMADVVSGVHKSQLGRVTIVDCRYPYEYEAGHIKGAINLYTKDDIHSLLTRDQTTCGKHTLIFHCEFSSERGPKMYRFLRAQDRELNKDSYPSLNFPEVYLLHGGYKAFYEQHKEMCDPVDYKPMLHQDHSVDLRHFRVKSKSWAAGDKAQRSRKCTMSRRNGSCSTLVF